MVAPEVQGGGSHSLLHRLLLQLLGGPCSNPGGGKRGFILSHLPGERITTMHMPFFSNTLFYSSHKFITNIQLPQITLRVSAF
jgi:hypothetical protein